MGDMDAPTTSKRVLDELFFWAVLIFAVLSPLFLSKVLPSRYLASRDHLISIAIKDEDLTISTE